MRAMFMVLALACAFALAADNTVVAPQPAINLQSTVVGHRSPVIGRADAITIPHMLSYQGKLTDTLGQPVPNGDYQLTFRLYTVPTGGSAFWSETQNVTTKSGFFDVLLGSATPIGAVPDGGELYLGMAVAAGAELAPRLRIASAAYAYKADTANYAAAAAPGGAAGGDLTGTYPSPTIAANAVGSAEVIDATLRGADVALPCTLSGNGSGTALLYVLPSNDGGIQVNRTSDGTTNSAIRGATTSGSGAGVIGEATGEDGASVGVVGHTTPGARPGVYGFNATNTVHPPAVAAGVAAYSASGPAFYTTNTAQACFRVDTSNASYTAIYLDSTGYNGYAVGAAGNDGLWVTRAGDRGVYVGASGTYGVYANCNDQRGGYFRNNNNSYYALTAYNNAGSGSTYKGLYVQGHGYATGGWQVPLGGGRGFGVVSPDQEIMASGTGQLVKGRASVNLETTFRDAISADVPLKVIVTPNSMCRGMCVASRSADGFSVAELADGTSNAGFDWIVIGRLKGAEQRLEPQPLLTDVPPDRGGLSAERRSGKGE